MMLRDEQATLAAGVAVGQQLRPGDIVTLSGPLGAGKTTFARGVLAGLGHRGEVASPSFPILIPYTPPAVRLPLAHVDLYRIERDAELEELGLDDSLSDGALVVEWPERLPPGLRRSALALTLTVAESGSRALTWVAPAAWEGRWPPPPQ